MRLRFLVAVVGMCAATLAAKADTYLFSYTPVPFFASVYNQPVSFDLSSTATPDISGTSTFVFNNVRVTYGGGTVFEKVGFGYGKNFAVSTDLSIQQHTIHVVDTPSAAGIFNAALYSGNTSAPTFNLGAYTSGFSNLTISEAPTAVTPEPSSLLLLATGCIGAVGALRRRLV